MILWILRLSGSGILAHVATPKVKINTRRGESRGGRKHANASRNGTVVAVYNAESYFHGCIPHIFACAINQKNPVLIPS